MITDFKDFKQKKQISKMKIELEDVIGRLSASLNSLKDYGKYLPIQESVSVLHNARTILEIHLDKAKKVLEKKDDQSS